MTHSWVSKLGHRNSLNGLVGVGKSVFAAICITGLTACAADETPDTPPQSKLEMLEGKIAGDAIMLMEPGDYSKTYSKLGKAQFDKANELTRWAALVAAESDQCDSVMLIAVSDEATREQVQWYADCANKERFQITQQQAEAARAKYDPAASKTDKAAAANVAVAEPKSARWKDFNERVALSECQGLVRSAMLDQDSFDTAWTWDSEKDDKTGKVVIQQDFEAGNAYGGTISSRYDCVIDTKLGGRVTELSIREPDGWRKLL